MQVKAGGSFFGGPAGRWPGATVVVAASGPSLTKQDLDFVRGKAKLIVVNATFKLAPWADVLYAADYRFWEVYAPKIFPNFQGEMWSVSEMARDKFGTYWIRCGTGRGFSREPDTINGGGNSGYQAIHLAATFGAKKIVLLGFDMQRTGGREHWHGKHEGNLPNGAGFGPWMKSMAFLATDLEQMGVDVVNCSRVTAMRCFRRATLEEVFDETANAAQRHPDDGPQAAPGVQEQVALGDVQGVGPLHQVGVQGSSEP